MPENQAILRPVDFERHVRGDGKRFHVRKRRNKPLPSPPSYQVFGVGLETIADCPTSEKARMVAQALEIIGDTQEIIGDI